MAKSIQKVALVLMLFSISTHAVDFRNPQIMAEHYQREIQEREDRNREKFNDLELRQQQKTMNDELRELKHQREIDRVIDESN